MRTSLYSAGSGTIVQYFAVGGAETTQIMSDRTEVETSHGLRVHINLRAQSGASRLCTHKLNLDSILIFFNLLLSFKMKVLTYLY